jgi:predicted hydrocarbon binding protein
MNSQSHSTEELQKENALLKAELEALKRQMFPKSGDCVDVPDEILPLFEKAQEAVSSYFSLMRRDPSEGEIEINGERYLLVRSASLSYDFLSIFAEMYGHSSYEQGLTIGKNMLFDTAHVLGKKDARSFHKKMHLKDPMEKLSAGPVHFAFTGWAKVEIKPDSNPVPNANFFLHYAHHNSFEASSWIEAKKASDTPVCIMNSGYASGWCSESFGLSLTAVELTCKAKGDDACTFIMAPVNRIESYLKSSPLVRKMEELRIPEFLERKKIEEQLKTSLEQKEVLLQEVHHRVKNNLQIITSLVRLQRDENLDCTQLNLLLDRITALSNIHQYVYRDPNMTALNLVQYIQRILNDGMQHMRNNGAQTDFQINADSSAAEISIDKAIPLGMLMNELLMDARQSSSSQIQLVCNVVLNRNKFSFELKFVLDRLYQSAQNEGVHIMDALSAQLDSKLNRSSKENQVSWRLEIEI